MDLARIAPIPAVEHVVDAGFDGRQRQDRHRPGVKPADPGDRGEVEIESEGHFVPPPPGDRVVQPVLQVGTHIEKGRRPGPAVEVFVGATHGEIDFGSLRDLSGTAPTLWLQSQRAIAPAAWAIAVTVPRSYV